MNNQQQPDQSQQVKKAKFILWLGIIVIIIVGLAVAVYFVFIKTSGQENVNAVKNANIATNINKAININVDTSDWQTVEYNHEPHIFSFQLPSDWQVNTQSVVAERQPMVSAYYDFNDGAVSFYVSYYHNTQSLKSWVDEHLKELEKSHEVISYQDSDFSHNDFTTVAGDVKEVFRHLHAYYSYSSYVYELMFELELDDYSSLKNILQAIISTFKFTDTTTTVDTSNWQTYENKTNGYSVKYPNDYLIKMETDNYVVFDPVSIDSPNVTYLHISVTVEDNDFHTYRLGILTDPAVESGSTSEEDVIIDGLDGKKINLKNALGETVIHYIVSYLGKVYDISAGDSVDSEILNNVLSSFQISQLADNVEISDINEFTGKACVSHNDCGAFPCVNSQCLIKECSSDSDCSNGTCGLHATPVPGYCTTIDML